MRSASRPAGGKRALRRVDIPADNLAAVARLLREAGPVLGEGNPVSAYAFFDREKRPRRVHAVFADGWRATLQIRKDGTASLSQALKMRGEIKGAVPA